MKASRILLLLLCAVMALLLLAFLAYLPKYIELNAVIHPWYVGLSSVAKLCLLYGITQKNFPSLMLFLSLHCCELLLLVFASEWAIGSPFSIEKVFLSLMLPTAIVILGFISSRKNAFR